MELAHSVVAYGIRKEGDPGVSRGVFLFLDQGFHDLSFDLEVAALEPLGAEECLDEDGFRGSLRPVFVLEVLGKLGELGGVLAGDDERCGVDAMVSSVMRVPRTRTTPSAPVSSGNASLVKGSGISFSVPPVR